MSDEGAAPEAVEESAGESKSSEAAEAAEDPAAKRRSYRDMIATVAIVGGLLAFGVGRQVVRALSKHPDREACERIVDRYAEQVARAADQKAPSSEERAADPTRGPSIDRCMRELTVAEGECAERSGYADELERCLP